MGFWWKCPACVGRNSQHCAACQGRTGQHMNGTKAEYCDCERCGGRGIFDAGKPCPDCGGSGRYHEYEGDTQIRIPKSIGDRLGEAARQRGVSRNNYIRMILFDAAQREPK